jgi:hypothetical protein
MRELLFLTTFALATPACASWAEVPLEVLVDEADLIVVGKVTKIQDGGFFTLGPLKSDHIGKMDVAVVEVSAILKALPQVGKPKELHIGQPGMGFVTSATVLFRPGQQGIWLLTKDPGPNKVFSMKGELLLPDPERNVYWAKHPSQFQDAKKQKEIVDLLAAREKLTGGKAVNGLVARTELMESPAHFQIRFSLKNVSDKTITICDYIGNRPLAVEWTGPEGKTLKSKHYDWLASADIVALGNSNFVAIPPGGIRFMEHKIVFQPPTDKPGRLINLAQAGKHKVSVSYNNKEDGKKFGLENVWTGTVTANEVSFTVK